MGGRRARQRAAATVAHVLALQRPCYVACKARRVLILAGRGGAGQGHGAVLQRLKHARRAARFQCEAWGEAGEVWRTSKPEEATERRLASRRRSMAQHGRWAVSLVCCAALRLYTVPTGTSPPMQTPCRPSLGRSG